MGGVAFGELVQEEQRRLKGEGVEKDSGSEWTEFRKIQTQIFSARFWPQQFRNQNKNQHKRRLT
jgi:hypothetical protein